MDDSCINQYIVGDTFEVLKTLPDEIVQTVVTSPPYWGLRTYGEEGQYGLEPTLEEHIETMVTVFRELRRVLRSDGTVWLNYGDCYAANRSYQVRDNKHCDVGNEMSFSVPVGLKPKDLCMIPARVAIALQADGWWLRSDIIWHKPNPMPESCTDRPTSSYEHIFLLAKSAKYFYDADAVREKAEDWGPRDRSNYRSGTQDPLLKHHGLEKGDFAESGRNLRNVWTIPTHPFSGWTETSHFYRVERGEPCDDKAHIVSPNCSDHGGLFDLLASVFCDEREADELIRNLHNDGDHAPEPKGDSDIFDQLQAYCFEGESLDCWPPECATSAIHRNKQIRRMARALATNPSYKPYAGRFSRIAGILKKHGLSEQALSILANNTWPDEMDARLQAEMISCSNDKSFLASSTPYCICPIYKKETKKSSHFATFPPALVKRCVLAGTSHKACEVCGAAWERVVEKPFVGDNIDKRSDGYVRPNGKDGLCRPPAGAEYKGKTTGFRPTCHHTGEDGTGKCIVLDPFMGSGTVAMVAQELGRDWIGIDLNPEYKDMAMKRLNGATIGIAI